MPTWEEMRASQEWPSVLIARFRPEAEYSSISAFLDGLDERRSTLPVARLETDFRARTLTIRMESGSESTVRAWVATLEESGLVEVSSE
jgi:hypothetical protein